MATFNLKQAVLVVSDGTTPTALNMTVKIGDGNLTYSETKNREYLLNRGLLDDVRDGDDVPVDLSFNFRWEYIKADTAQPAMVEDVLKKRGVASAWVTTSSDACAPYCVDLTFTFTPACSAEEDEALLFSDFFYEKLDHDAKAASISCSGKCNVTEATSTRS